MQKIFLPLVAILISCNVFAQNTFKAIIQDSITEEKLFGVTAIIQNTNTGGSSDTNGNLIISNIPNGNHNFMISYLGYQSKLISVAFPLNDSAKSVLIPLVSKEKELNTVVISSTRSSRTIANTPTRVKTIDLEEIDEKNNMRPANVSMMLHESTGIQVQQTSATSGSASIRIQGLDGKYTQLLKDGYPNFGNFASGLSLLEIPPLDLKQVEVIKGPSSTLYGGGAIAGVVNFISKTPQQKPEYSFILNQSNVGQTNIGAFASQRKNKMGYTLLALVNKQKAYDVDKDDFTELPKSSDFTLHPKVFYYPNNKTTLMIGNAFTQGDRLGGDINVINNKADNQHTYFEENKTLRNTTTIELERQFKNKNHFTARTSFTYFNRAINLSNYQFKGSNSNSFTDLAYVHNFKKQTLIIGGNFIHDNFSQHDSTVYQKKNFTTNTAGIYAQHTWDISEKIKLESGLRTDVVNYFNQHYSKTESFVLPRISALFKLSKKLSSRIGGGLGYKAPSIFTEQTESFQYQNLIALNHVTAEKSIGSTIDINYKTSIGKDWFCSLNQLFFYTNINNATILQMNNAKQYFFANTNQPVISQGFETNAKIVFKEDVKLFAGYTYTHAIAKYLSPNQFLPLLPKSKLNLALVYEKEKNFKLGLEAYFSDQQYLSNGLKTSSFWEFGAMAEKTFGKVSLFINFENFTNVRQSSYKRVVNEPHNNPTFDEIWTHTEGFVVNGGIKIKL